MKDFELLSFILRQVDKIPGKKKRTRKYINVVCPFHADHNPSLGIRIAPPALGSIKCLACGEKGGWNKLAERLHLDRIVGEIIETEAWVNTEQYSHLVATKSKTISGILSSQYVSSHSKWPANKEWRGYSGKFLSRFEPLYCLRPVRYTQERIPMIWFPVYIDQELVGGFLGHLEKPKDKTKPTYMNSPGEWVSTEGLWPYDYVCAKKPPVIVLVEGQRDCLRLLRAGIPALCVFGTQNFTVAKANLVRSMPGLNQVLLFGDNDKAGRAFNIQAKGLLKDKIKTGIITLPKSLEGEDPGSVPFRYIKMLRTVVRTSP